MVAASTRTIDSEAPAVETVVSEQTNGAVVTSYSIVSGASPVTIVETATSVSSVYTSTMSVASISSSTATAVQSIQGSTVTVGAVTVTSDVVIPSGYTTVTASGNTVTTTEKETVATGVATVTAPVVTESGSSTITSGISTVTEQAGPVSFKTVYRRDEKLLVDDKAEENHEVKQDKKDASARPWFAFDGLMTEIWM